MTLFNCPNCDKKYTRKENLDYHLNNAKFKCKVRNLTDFQPDEQNQTLCTICDKKYATKSSLKRHLISVHQLTKDDIKEAFLNIGTNDIVEMVTSTINESDERLSDNLSLTTVNPDSTGRTKFMKDVKKTFTCPLCSETFGHNSSLKRHLKLKRCVELQSTQSVTNNNAQTIVNGTVGSIDNSQNDNRQMVVNNTGPMLNNQNMFLLSYGKEDDDEWDEGVYRKHIRKGVDSVSSFIEEVHFNPDHPERQNLLLKNRTGKNVEMYRNGRWIEREADEVIRDMCYDKMDILFYCYEDNSDTMKGRRYDNFERIAKAINKKEKAILEQQYQLIRNVMHDNRGMVDKNRKLRAKNPEGALPPSQAHKYITHDD